ncbi:hypothetical protein D3C78_1601540 [compost metagenome]
MLLLTRVSKRSVRGFKGLLMVSAIAVARFMPLLRPWTSGFLFMNSTAFSNCAKSRFLMPR